MSLENFVADTLSLCYIEVSKNLEIKSYNKGFEKLFKINGEPQKLDFYFILPNKEPFTFETLSNLSEDREFYLHANQNIPHNFRCKATISKESMFIFAEILAISDIEVIAKLSQITSKLASSTRELHKKNLQLTQAQKELEAKDTMIIAQSRFGAINELLMMLSHQWRQPLATISLLSASIAMELEEKSDKPDEVILEMLEQIDTTTQKLSNTIELFTSSMSKENEVVTTLNEVLDNVFELIEPTLINHTITLQKELAENIKIKVSPTILSQICIIIIQNSIDAFERNSIEKRSLLIKTHNDANFIFLSFTDNAGGIHATDLPKIFEPYFSTKTELDGVGLGLYIAQLLLKKVFKGYINLQSDGEAVTVNVQIPFKEVKDER